MGSEASDRRMCYGSNFSAGCSVHIFLWRGRRGRLWGRRREPTEPRWVSRSWGVSEERFWGVDCSFLPLGADGMMPKPTRDCGQCMKLAIALVLKVKMLLLSWGKFWVWWTAQGKFGKGLEETFYVLLWCGRRLGSSVYGSSFLFRCRWLLPQTTSVGVSSVSSLIIKHPIESGIFTHNINTKWHSLIRIHYYLCKYSDFFQLARNKTNVWIVNTPTTIVEAASKSAAPAIPLPSPLLPLSSWRQALDTEFHPQSTFTSTKGKQHILTFIDFARSLTSFVDAAGQGGVELGIRGLPDSEGVRGMINQHNKLTIRSFEECWLGKGGGGGLRAQSGQ